MTRQLEFDSAVAAAEKALRFALELDSCQERGLVVRAAERLIAELRYFEKARARRERVS